MNSLNVVMAIGALSAIVLSSGIANASPPVSAGQANVMVIGGTPAGVAAAIAAARLGEDVVLISDGADLGGTLTDAEMDQWDLNLAPNGATVERGIFAQIYARLGDAFTPQAASHALADMIAAEPRITVRYDEVARSAMTVADGVERRVASVTFANVRSGALRTLSAPFIVDATDDGDVAALAGARYDVGRQDTGLGEQTQAVTLMFTLGGVDWQTLARTYDVRRFGAGGVVGRRAWGYSSVVRDYRPLAASVVVRDLNFGLLPDGSLSVNAIDATGVDGLDPAELDAARRVSEREAYRLATFLSARLPGFAAAHVTAFAPDVYVRETRHIAGLERLTTQDVWSGSVPADSIGLASYPIDLHPVDPADEPAFAPVRHVYGIPFGTLVPRGLTNVVLAGPAISASHLASGSARVIPTTIEEGEAAGIACAVAHSEGLDFADFGEGSKSLAHLRSDLAAAGVLLEGPRPLLIAHAPSATRRFAASRIRA